MDKEELVDLITELTKEQEPLETKKVRWDYYIRAIKWTGLFTSILAGAWLAQYLLYVLFQFPIQPHCQILPSVAPVCK